MDNSSFKFSRINSNSIDKYTSTNKNNLSNSINEIEIQIRPSTSKCSLDYSNINNSKNDKFRLNYASEPLETKYNLNKSNILGEKRHYSYRRVIPSMVKPEFIRKKEKLLNNGNISLSMQSIVANEMKDVNRQNLCRKLGDSVVQNVNTNLSLVPKDINHKPKPVKLLSIPLSDTNKTCLSNHNLNSHRIATHPLERTLQTTTNIIQNQGTFPESLTLKKLQLAARAEQLRIAEEIVQKKEEEADAIEWQAIQEREATLFEKERLLEAREKAAEKKYDEAVKSIEKCRYEMLELNESKSDTANSLDNSFISNVSANQINYNKMADKNNDGMEYAYSSENQKNFHTQQQFHPENILRSGGQCKILPYNNILSKCTGKNSIKKQKKSFHALDLCKIEPRLELSSLKHTYSRKSPKKRFEETKSNNFGSHFSQPHNLKFSQPNIDLPGSSRTMNEQTLVSDSGTITITQLPKFDQPLRPFSAFPRLSSLCSKDKSEIQHPSSPVLSRMENCPSRISINYSPCSSSSETSMSITEKVGKLTSDLQFHSLTMDKEQEGYTSVREHDIKPKIIDFSQNALCQSNEKIIKPVADQIKYLRNYDNNENSKKMFLQIAPHCYTINTDYSIPGTCETNVDVSNIKASYKLSASICDSRRSKSFEDKTSKCRDYAAESLHYQSLNYESSVNNFTENSENQTVPLISKVDALERQDKDKVISDNELDFYNCNLNVKPRNEGDCNAVRLTQESRSLLPKQVMGIKNITLPSGQKNSISHFVINDCKRSNFEKIITNDKDIHSEIFTNNCVQIVKVLPCSQFISVEDGHNNKYENGINTSVQSPEADFIQIKYHTSNDSLQVTSLLSNDDQISTDIQNGELDCFEKNEKSSTSYEISSDVLNAVHETFPSAAFRNGEELTGSSSEANVTSCDKRISNINNVEIQNMSLENISVSHVMECDEVQTFPLDLGIEKEFNHATISNNTCAKNIKSEDNCISKQEVISPTNFDTPCIASANQEFYLPSNLIYTSQSQELLPSCDISYSNNCSNEICPNGLIYAGSHLESDVKHLNLNSTHLQDNSDELPEKQSTSDFSLVKTSIENYDPSLKDMTLLDCSANKSNNFKNSDLEFNAESSNSSALFPADGQKSFNLLSSTFIENCEDDSNDTNFSSESFQEPNFQSRSIEATNLKDNYIDVTKENSLYYCNNNNIDKVMSSGGRILKMKRLWNTDADADTVKSDDRKDQIKSDYQNSFVDNDSDSLKESNLKPRKKRGRKKGVKRMMLDENSENKERPHWKQCIWIANIIPSAMRNNNSLECGKCAKVFSSVQTFKSHAYSSHNGLVRLKGDSQEFDEPLMNEILSVVFKVKKKLICSECKKSFKSLVGYKYHSERCGKMKADFYSFCKICNKKLLSTSIETHEKNHDNKIRLKAEKKLLEMKRKKISNDNDLEKSVGRTPRKAAKYCHDQMKLLYGSIDSEYDDDSADKDFIEEEADKYFYSHELKSPDKSHKFDEFNKNILKFGESKCLTIGCDLIFKDIKQLKLHLRMCSSPYVTCKLCLSTIKRININEHLEECRKDNASNDSDDFLSDEDEHDSVIDSSKTSKVLTIRFKQYQYSKEMTKYFRKINYSDCLYATLVCHSKDWIAVNDDDLHLYQSRLPHSPLFSLLKNPSDKEISWEKIQNLKGNVLGSSEIFFAGGSIRSVAWCPIPMMNNEPSQYIAVSCTNNPNQSCPINKSEKHNGLLQIWHCGNLTKPEIPELSLGIAHENGVIWSMEWCPSGIYESPYASTLEDSVIKRLGLLAAAFSDGIIRVYLIPHPYQIASKNKIFKKDPEFSLCPYDYENLDLQCVKVSWCASKNHSLIAGSFTNGMVCIWNLNCTSTLLSFQDSGGGTKLYPINSISAHNGVCSAVSFFPKTEGRHIVTGGYDRTIKFWDLMQPEHPLNVIKKGIVTDSVWLPHWAGAFFSFDDAYSLGKTTTTFRENGFYGSTFRSVLGTNATVWSISGSDWLNAIVQADEAGEVILSLQHNLNCEIQGEKHMSKKRFPLFSAKIEKVKNEKTFCDESSQFSNEKTSFEDNILQTEEQYQAHNDTNESSSELFMEQPLTYAASMENYGIKFYDEDYQDPSKLDEISIRSKQCSELMEPGPLTQYPLMGGSSVSWNNNYGAHTWICVGFHSGLVRIVQIPRLE